MNNSKIQNEKKERKQAASSHKLLASHGSRSPDHQPAAPFLAASPPKNQQQQCAAGQAAPPLREAFLAAVSWPGLPEAAERARGERVRRPGVVGGGEGGEGEKKQQQEGNEEQPYEEYEVVIDKPYGFKFAKGRDGGTYIDAIFPGASADKTGKFTVGDKVLATSAVFGEEIWPAAACRVRPDHVLHPSESWPSLHEDGEKIWKMGWCC